jgi:hypothetical protein
MMMHLGYSGLGNFARVLLIASAALLISAPVSVGQSEDTAKLKEARAIAVCTDSLTTHYGAIELSNISHRHRSGHRSVYATARLASGETPRFRCIVRHGTDIVRVQVYADGSLSITNSKSGWISAEPYRVRSEPEAEAPVETPPENETESAEVPSESGPKFTAPGEETGFKAPGTRNESQFKPSK